MVPVLDVIFGRLIENEQTQILINLANRFHILYTIYHHQPITFVLNLIMFDITHLFTVSSSVILLILGIMMDPLCSRLTSFEHYCVCVLAPMSPSSLQCSYRGRDNP